MSDRKPLRCPDCGDTISVNLGWEGGAYTACQVVEGYECDDYRCGASWNSKGEPEGIT